MNLFNVVDELMKLSELEIDYETGEIDEEIEKKIEKLNFTYDKKMSNIWALLKNWGSEVDIIDNEVKRLNQRKTTLKNAIERLKKYAAQFLEPGKKWKSQNTTAEYSWRKSTKCIVCNENDLNSKYLVTTIRPDLNYIKNDIKSGVDVPGATLDEKQNLIIK